MNKRSLAAAVIAILTIGGYTAFAQTAAPNMSFFVTSSNPKGGNLGGLAGADAVCQSLARAAGAGGKTWHAYLSTSTVDAKSRIGNGPWYNFKGQQIASNVAEMTRSNHTGRLLRSTASVLSQKCLDVSDQLSAIADRQFVTSICTSVIDGNDPSYR